MQNQNCETHYILVIHGTFSASIENQSKWYQLDPENSHNFCTQLSNLFQGTILNGAVWKDFEPGKEFSWSGANNHDDRINAAQKLLKEINNIVKKNSNARIHFIAHSHGGNVLLKTLEKYYTNLIIEAKKDINKTEDFKSKTISDDDLVKWSTSPENNHIGKIVFLGTPFLRKQWYENKHGIFDSVLENIFAIPGFLLFFTSFVTVFGSGFSFIFLIISWIIISIIFLFATLFTSLFLGTHPIFPVFELNILLLLKVCLIASFSFGVFGGISQTIEDIRKSRKYNTNFYFDEHEMQKFSSSTKKIPALVLNSINLDEAFTGLASEALVYGSLVPTLEQIIDINIGLDFDKSKVMGKIYASEIEGFAIILETILVSPITFVLDNILKLLKKILIPIQRKIIKPYLTNILLQLICSTAYGIPALELKGARVEVKAKLEMPTLFDEKFCDITKHIFHKDNSSKYNNSNPKKLDYKSYYYMFNEGAVRERCEEIENSSSLHLWKKISDNIESFYEKQYKPSFELDQSNQISNNGKLDIAKYKWKLAATWFTLEERVKKALGSIELIHCLYYSNTKTINEISEFLLEDLT